MPIEVWFVYPGTEENRKNEIMKPLRQYGRLQGQGSKSVIPEYKTADV
jgi:hypothetical protein